MAHSYSFKRFAGKSTPIIPKRSQSYSFGLTIKQDISRSMSETFDISNKRMNTQQGSKETKENKWDPPFDIQRPNCIPGYGPYSIANFKDEQDESRPSSPMDSFDEDMFDTKKSNTPSSSGDSGYGTTTTRTKSNNSNNNKKVQDLFEALFAPVVTPPPSLKIQPSSTVSHSGVNSKLSLLFSKKNDPHYVKFQTWSNNQQLQQNLSTPLLKKVSSMRRPHEESLFKTTTNEWSAIDELSPTIKIEKEHPPPRKQSRGRRRTDASLQRIIPPEAIQTSKPKHTRCKSIGSTLAVKTLDVKSPTLTVKSPTLDPKSPILFSPIDTSNILDHCDEKGTLIARYVSMALCSNTLSIFIQFNT